MKVTNITSFFIVTAIKVFNQKGTRTFIVLLLICDTCTISNINQHSVQYSNSTVRKLITGCTRVRKSAHNALFFTSAVNRTETGTPQNVSRHC